MLSPFVVVAAEHTTVTVRRHTSEAIKLERSGYDAKCGWKANKNVLAGRGGSDGRVSKSSSGAQHGG